MERTSPSFATLSASSRDLLDRVRERFELAWQQAGASGTPPEIDDFLKDVPTADRGVLLQGLVALDVDQRRRRGEHPTPETYRERFPEAGPSLAAIFPDPGGTVSHHAGDPNATVDHARSAETATTAAPGKGGGAGGGRTLPTVPGYEVLKELGRGGMGVVYLARQVGLKRLVALKMILAGTHASPTAISRFRAEAESVARLQHPGIVQIHEIGEHEGLPFFSLEYVDGGPLNRRLGGNPLPPRDAAQVALTLAVAMDVAHGAGVVHRDLKPANILVAARSTTRPGAGDTHQSAATATAPSTPTARDASSADVAGERWQLKITDFGLAKQLDDTEARTASGDIMGTPSYMAPEQAEGRLQDIGPVTDVYALGAILYELLTGRPPFKAASFWDTLELVRHQDPVPPRQLQPGTPRDLETICLKCLRKETTRRYASAAQLAEDLQRYLDGEAILARPVGRVERLFRWCRRRPAQAALVTVTAAATLVLIGLGYWFSAVSGAQKAETAFAKKLSATHAFYRTLGEVRERRLRRATGWTWKNRDVLGTALTANLESAAISEVMTEAVATLSTVDLRERRVVGEGITASAVAFTPDGRCVVLGQERGQAFGVLGGCAVLVIDARSGETHHKLTFTPDWGFQVRAGKQDGVRSLAISPDGRWLVVGSRTGWLHRWDLTQSAPTVTSWRGHTETVFRLAFTPDSRFLFSSAGNGYPRRWRVGGDWPSDSEEKQVAWGDTVYLPSRDLFAFVDEGGIGFLDAEYYSFTRPGPRVPSTFLGASPDDRVLIYGHGRMLDLLDLRGVPLDPLIRPGSRTTDDGVLSDAVFSLDGTLLATASTDTQRVVLWDMLGSRYLGEIRVGAGLLKLAFSPDGATLAVTGENRAVLYELAGRRLVTTSVLGAFPLAEVVTSAAGQVACLEAWDQAAGLVTVRPSGSGMPRYSRRVVHHNDVLALSPDGRYLATPHFNNLGVTDLASRRLREAPADRLRRAAFDSEGALWTSQGINVSRWDLDPLRTAATWNNTFGDALSGKGAIFALAPGRRETLVGLRDGALHLLSREARLQSSRERLGGEITCTALAPNEAWVAAGSMSGQLCLIPLPVGTPWKTTLDDAVTSVCFLSDDLLASGGQDGLIRLWRREGSQAREVLALPCPAPVRRLATADNGRELIVLLDGERGLRTWHLSSLLEGLEELGLAARFRLPVPGAPAHVPPPVPLPEGPGLIADLFVGEDLNLPLHRRIDPNIDFDWGRNSPDEVSMPTDNFSVRWRGWLKAPAPGDYVLSVKADDGLRLWLDGKLLLDGWREDLGKLEAEVRLTDRPHRLRVDYFEKGGSAYCHVFWGRGKRGSTDPRQPIPPTALFTSEEAALKAK